MKSLSLKSTSLDGNDTLGLGQNHAVLCTEERTFKLRQVHSSNSVHVIAPAEAKARSHTAFTGDFGLRVIAQCATTLELIPAAAEAKSFLKVVLPLYRSPDSLIERGVDVENHYESAGKGSKQKIFENLPVSRQEFEDAWLHMCAFEANGHAWVPSSSDCSGIWRLMMSAAVLKNTNLVGGFHPNDLGKIVIEQDLYPKALFEAVLRRLCRKSSNVKDLSM